MGIRTDSLVRRLAVASLLVATGACAPASYHAARDGGVRFATNEATASPPTAWTERMVRPCAHSGNRMTC